MPKLKKVNNNKTPKKKVENVPLNDIDTHLFNKKKLTVDFSFEGSFMSCKVGEFNNYLTNNDGFTLKFRDILRDVQHLSDRTMSQIISGGEYRHCHRANDEPKAMQIIKTIFISLGKTDDHFEQLVGGEEIYQIGLQSEIRLFGTIKGNIFHTYFIDYYHDFQFDQRRNLRNKKHCNFCAIKSEV